MHKFVQKLFPRRPVVVLCLSIAIIAEVCAIVYASGGVRGEAINPSLTNTGAVNGICIYEYETPGYCNAIQDYNQTCALSTRVQKWYFPPTPGGSCYGNYTDPTVTSGFVPSQTSGNIDWAGYITPSD